MTDGPSSVVDISTVGLGYSTQRRCLLIAGDRRRSATHRRIMIMTGSLDVTPKTTRHNLIVCIGKSEAEISRLCRRIVLLKLTQTDTKHCAASLRQHSLLYCLLQQLHQKLTTDILLLSSVFCGILASPPEVSQRGGSTSAAHISSNGMVVQ